jgi:hypothetical protein
VSSFGRFYPLGNVPRQPLLQKLRGLLLGCKAGRPVIVLTEPLTIIIIIIIIIKVQADEGREGNEMGEETER